MANVRQTDEPSPEHRIPAGSGSSQPDRMLQCHSSRLVNRLARTRMLGGVKGLGLAAPPY